MAKRILVRTPRGIRSIIQNASASGSPSETFEITQNISQGSNLIQHNKGVKILEAFYVDGTGWNQELTVNTEHVSDDLNQVWVYSGSDLGVITVTLKS